ncbi:MAG: glycosyltransferase family 4 protein [Alcaligenaceae bacterium]|nr:glycosyltransferase family 4 protein [Alcaligenaceae bacterium]
MKILFTNFHKRNGGGHATYIVNLLSQLAQRHDCYVATPGTSRLYRFAQSIPHVEVIDQGFNSRIGKLFGEVKQLRALVKQEKFDIIHVNASADHRHVMLACLGLKHRPKIILTKHNDHPVNSFGHKLRAKLATDRIIAVSHYVAAMFKNSSYAHIPVDMIHHGIDTRYFAPASTEYKQQCRQSLLGEEASQNGLILLGSTGGTDYEKGWLEMVLAVSLLPGHLKNRCRIIMAGDPPNEEKMNRVKALGMAQQLVFPGLVDDVRGILAACDLGFVLSHKEALSFACRESMALGLPTIASNAGGLPENIQHGKNGWIVPVKNPEALTKLLADILVDPDLLARIASASRQTAEQDFNLDAFASNTVNSYQQALNLSVRP